MIVDYLVVIFILVAGTVWSIKRGKLTFAAAIAGAVIGFLTFVGTGFCGLATITTFFILGTTATSWKHRFKEQQGLAETNKGKRNAGQVFANAGVAGLLALASLMYPHYRSLFTLMVAGSFASASADTLSSELGNVYGKKYYNILSFKKDQRGLDGVISFEGTAYGIGGSTIIAIVYTLFLGINVFHFISIIAAGTIGNLCDSYLGATVERAGYLGNNAVNFANTLIAALSILLLFLI